MHLTLSPARTTRKAATATTASHARSASEPCHPALARLDGTVRALRAWSTSCSSSSGSSSSGCSSSGHGLALLDSVLGALGDLLATPQAASALHANTNDDQEDLDGFLVLADAYGAFEAALLAAKQSVAGAQAGARLGDGAMVAASARAHRRAQKELRRLAAAAMRHAASRHAAPVPSDSSADAAGVVAGAVAEANVAAAEASAAVFSGCAAAALSLPPDVSAMAVKTAASHGWLARLGVAPGPGARKVVAPEIAPAAVLQRLEELEERIDGLERESEKVFRRLVQARVLLLNIHNPL